MSFPPTSSKPYKSRLLNFVNRNYIKFNSQINTKFREWGYVIKGGLQDILLPFVWLWRKTNINQVFTGEKKSNASLPYSRCDELIVTVREKMTVEKDFPLLLTHEFQGLASQINNRKIVAIVGNNKSKDIIPIQKQEEIVSLIKIIVQDYELRKYPNTLITWIDKFIAQVESVIVSKQDDEEENTLNNISEEIINQQENFSLINIIKSAIDYFFGNKNTHNGLNGNVEAEVNQITSNKQDKSLSSLKGQKNNNVLPLSEKNNASLVNINIIPQAKNISNKIINLTINQLANISNSININSNKNNDPFQIKLIILAAIEYFFSKDKKISNPQINGDNKNEKSTILAGSDVIIIREEISESWLSWEDLYGDNNSSYIENNQQLTPSQDESFNTNQHKKIETNSKNNSDNFLSSNNINNADKISNKNKEETDNLVNQNSLNHQNNLDTENEIEIEAKVIEIKYEKHFLQVILEKLDQLILWIEEIIIKIIKKFRK
ncbi:hypothetical protein WEU38_09135 [Cyanobacterium aponinum AL20118]|uniref:Uncharacterized protein n=1 Tax=Cyanobacterium aponinum AL20115 TaxID=3090662 RepID=A0AAF0Z8U2_9CHRO|nr:hypothetical protein [Cyanobacterium aponinum]WPF86985.1 hypothetical protein SAY89_09155 [Cyanobacterium aponinum AL20115]